MIKRRRGRVEIDMRALRRDHQSALAISRDLVVWHIDENIMMYTATWWAESDHFEPISEGEIPPIYNIKATTNDAGETSVTFVKK